MSLQVVFLGTAGSIPTPTRALPAIAIQRKGELIMFDCGEGIQRQMIQAKVGFHRKNKVFITHMHGDHVLGLPGMLQTMSLLDRKEKLKVYGPVGIQAFIEAINTTVQFTLTFPVAVTEIDEANVVFEDKEYQIYAFKTDHVVPSFGYALIEKPRPGRFNPEKANVLDVPEGKLWSQLQYGKKVKLADGRVIDPKQVMGAPRQGRKIVYSGDTRPAKSLTEIARNADLLIHEATFDDELLERAQEDGHSTPSHVAEIAKNAQVKRLVLTHISARYKNAQILLEQARKIFPNVDLAEDFMKIEIPLLKA